MEGVRDCHRYHVSGRRDYTAGRLQHGCVGRRRDSPPFLRSDARTVRFNGIARIQETSYYVYWLEYVGLGNKCTSVYCSTFCCSLLCLSDNIAHSVATNQITI